jgi:hypothetical protein
VKRGRPRLSLCLIVRDEARFLQGCLASVAGLADELVVVDTGSTDDTVQIARAAGAKVGHFTWVNDFAAARNHSLDLATGAWVLHLDADERLGPSAAEVIGEVLDQDELDCAFLPLHDASRLDATAEEVLSGAARLHAPTLLPRLFRRHPEARYQSPIHENLDAWITAPGRRYRAVNAPIVHYGAVVAHRADRNKSDRNLNLLAARVQAAPDDVRSRVFLAHELQGAGRVAEACAEMVRAWRDTVAAHAEGRRGPALAAVDAEFVGGWGALMHLGAGDADTARDMAEQAMAWGGAHPNLSFSRGVVRELAAWSEPDPLAQRRLLESAKADYSDALAGAGRAFSITVSAGVDGHQARLRRGTVALGLGLPAEALEDLELVVKELPEHIDARLGIAEAHLRLGEPLKALGLVKPLLGPTNGDAWLIAALCLEAMGKADQSGAWRDLARKLHAQRPLRPHRQPLLQPRADGARP